MKKLILVLLTFLSFASYGQAEYEKIAITDNVATASTSKIVSQQPVGGELNYINATALPLSTATIDALKLKADLSTGLLKNGLVVANVDPTKINITAGIGIVSNFDDPENPTSTIISFPDFIGVTPAYLNTGNITYFAINSSAAVVMQASPFTNIQRRDLIVLGAAIHSNLTTVNLVNNISAPTNADTNQLHDFMEAIGALNVSGNKYFANGANLSLDKSAGVIFKLGVNFANNWKDPHNLTIASGTALTFRYRTQNGAEGADVTTLNPAVYDLANVLTAVPSNKFTIQTVTLFQTGATRVQYGQTTYASMAEAEAAIISRAFVVEPNIAANGITRAYIILRNSTTSLLNASDAKIVEAQKFGGVASGGVAVTDEAIIAAIGYTPENIANKQNSLAVDGSGTKYVTVDAVNAKIKTINSFNPSISKYTAIGDSITVGVGSTGDNTSYFNLITAYLPFLASTKDAASGATVKPVVGRPKLSDLVATVPIDSNLITVMIGVNDWDLDNPIGNTYDILNKTYASLNETNSFSEAFRYNLETLKINFPTAKIIVITPIKAFFPWQGSTPLRMYINAEIEIANYLSIPVINAYDNSGIYGTSPYMFDALHPNDLGYQIIANQVLSGIIHNPESNYSSLMNTLNVADEVTFGRTDEAQIESKIVVKGTKGVTHSRVEFYPYYGNTPTTVIFTNGDGTGGGFSYFAAQNGRYGFGHSTDDTVHKLQVVGGTKTDVLNISTTPTTSASNYHILTINDSTGVVEKVVDNYAKTASPTFTGTPTAPTATVGTNTTQVATTAFVLANAGALPPHLEFNNTDKTIWNNGGGNGITNTSYGQEALKSITIGTSNTANGYGALSVNTEGSGNTANGFAALLDNTIGAGNTAIGDQSLRSSTTGNSNTAIGNYALRSSITGNNNIAVGVQAGYTLSSLGANTITNNSIFLGYDTRPLANNETNQIVIGSQALGNGSNTATIGNDAITKTVLKGVVVAPLTTNVLIDAEPTGKALVTKEWVANFAKYIIKDVTPTTALTGSTVQTIGKSYLIPANTFTANDILNVSDFRTVKVGTAGTLTTRIYVNTTDTLTGATLIGTRTGATTVLLSRFVRDFIIEGGLIKGLNFGAGTITDFTESNATLSTASFNPAVANYIITTLQLSNAADSVTQQAFVVTD